MEGKYILLKTQIAWIHISYQEIGVFLNNCFIFGYYKSSKTLQEN